MIAWYLPPRGIGRNNLYTRGRSAGYRMVPVLASCCLLLLPGCGEDGGDQCAAGQTPCNESCVVTASDPEHCGRCDNKCSRDELCGQGTCVLACPAGSTHCGGGDAQPPYCARLSTDSANCGACGNKCAGGKACSSGMCAHSCQGGLTNCSGVCVNLSNNL